jgi:hypothetical protein
MILASAADHGLQLGRQRSLESSCELWVLALGKGVGRVPLDQLVVRMSLAVWERPESVEPKLSASANISIVAPF